ncbi:MAG TPA: rubredoxin, partial [Mycobacterium sp.]|nr:rubredoxin [Mycobacterium sp.]
TGWEDLPEDWGCPDCAVVEKPDFEILEVRK